MKKTKTILWAYRGTAFMYRIFLLFLLTANCLVQTATGQWAALGGAGFSAGWANYTSIATDGTDTPYMAYADFAYGNKVTVMKYNGSNWVTVGNAGFSAGPVANTSLAIDGNGTPYVVFQDFANFSCLTVMKFNGSAWVTVGATSTYIPNGFNADLAIDANNTPYIAYGGVGVAGNVIKYNGSSWVWAGGANLTEVQYISLDFDPSNTPYVAYQDVTNGYKATVRKLSGGLWVPVGSVGFSTGVVEYTSLVIDDSGRRYVAYNDWANGNRITVMEFKGNWVPTNGGTGFSPFDAEYITLAVDTSGMLYAGFSDGGKATVMQYSNNNWQTVGNARFSTGWAMYTSLALDRNGTPFVAYRDVANGLKTTVMRYTVPNIWNGSTWSLGTPDSTHNVEIESNTAPTSFSCNNLAIGSGMVLRTGTGDVATIYGDLTNNGNGVSGTGTLVFTKNGTSTLSGDTIEHEGTIQVESGCTLATGNKLRLLSNAMNTGRIGESAGTITGNVIAQRYQPGKRCYRFYGHPFRSSIALSQLTDEIDITGAGGASNGFTTTNTNNASAFYWDVNAADNSTAGNNPGWARFSSANTASWDRYELLRLLVRGEKGQGLTTTSYTPVASTFEAAGEVNQGTQVITLTKGSNSDFVACGNPFPSAVQMNTVARGSNVGANYYAWDATSGVAGAYVTNAWTLSYRMPAYGAFFTTVSANTNNTLEFEEADKLGGGAALFKTTAPANWVELLISDSSTKWDRLLINLDDNAMDVEDNLDGKKLYNPGLDFFTLSKDDVRLAVDVRPYNDGNSIPLGLTAYNRYNRYVIKTGMFDIPAGTKLYLHDKWLNKKEELKAGFEYWFDVTTDTLSQGNNRFEINMVGKPTNGIAFTKKQSAKMQLVPNPAREEVKISFDKLEGRAQLKLTSITGQVIFSKDVNASTGSITIPLHDIPAGIYIAELQSDNARFTERLIKE